MTLRNCLKLGIRRGLTGRQNVKGRADLPLRCVVWHDNLGQQLEGVVERTRLGEPDRAVQDAPQAVGGYAQAVSVEGAKRLVFVSGQIPADQSGKVPSAFAEQARRLVLRNPPRPA